MEDKEESEMPVQGKESEFTTTRDFYNLLSVLLSCYCIRGDTPVRLCQPRLCLQRHSPTTVVG